MKKVLTKGLVVKIISAVLVVCTLIAVMDKVRNNQVDWVEEKSVVTVEVVREEIVSVDPEEAVREFLAARG